MFTELDDHQMSPVSQAIIIVRASVLVDSPRLIFPLNCRGLSFCLPLCPLVPCVMSV